MSIFTLTGKRVLLTGASRGIGRATADLLLAHGARLVLVGRDREALAAVLRDRDGHAVVAADLSAADQGEPIAEQALAALGGLDAFVSVAGIVEYAAVGEISSASLERQLRVNCTTPLLIAQRLAMDFAPGGSVVFVASTLAAAPAPLTAGYAASKAALVAGARSLALELGPRGIRVNAIAPGIVDTEMVRVVRRRLDEAPLSIAVAGARISEQLDGLRRLHPLQRLGQPDDVAQSVLYLLSAPYVTGTVLVVDGGLMLGSGEP